jgi:hypothetical protein
MVQQRYNVEAHFITTEDLVFFAGSNHLRSMLVVYGRFYFRFMEIPTGNNILTYRDYEIGHWYFMDVAVVTVCNYETRKMHIVDPGIWSTTTKSTPSF